MSTCYRTGVTTLLFSPLLRDVPPGSTESARGFRRHEVSAEWCEKLQKGGDR